jgi:uncharacterized membrane protein YphA (DoxX/SURF4 family)
MAGTTNAERDAAVRSGPQRKGRAMNYILWTLQALLALLFLFSGVMKFVMSVAEMQKQIVLPGWFLHFIGAMEILGGLGLVLPGLLRIRPGLTPLAAAGLVIIMVGATVINLKTGPVVLALLTAILSLLAAFVAYNRWRISAQ